MKQENNAEESVAPGINTGFEDPQSLEKYVEHFSRSGREMFDHRFQILDACQLDSKMSVADVGAGTGELTTLIASRVETVFAIDIFPHFLEHIRIRCKSNQLPNVETILSTPRSTNLPADCVDLALVFNTYHHLEYPRSVIRSIQTALREDGSIILVDLHPAKEGPGHHVRASAETFAHEICKVGFEEIPISGDFLVESYIKRFRVK